MTVSQHEQQHDPEMELTHMFMSKCCAMKGPVVILLLVYLIKMSPCSENTETECMLYFGIANAN